MIVQSLNTRYFLCKTCKCFAIRLWGDIFKTLTFHSGCFPHSHSSTFLFVFYLKEALKALWKAAFPEEELRGLISEQWKEMGWQGKDPSTDFRYISTSLRPEKKRRYSRAYSTSFWLISRFCLLQSWVVFKLFDWFCRGGGFISLENLLYFARNFPVCPLSSLFCGRKPNFLSKHVLTCKNENITWKS